MSNSHMARPLSLTRQELGSVAQILLDQVCLRLVCPCCDLRETFLPAATTDFNECAKDSKIVHQYRDRSIERVELRCALLHQNHRGQFVSLKFGKTLCFICESISLNEALSQVSVGSVCTLQTVFQKTTSSSKAGPLMCVCLKFES